MTRSTHPTAPVEGLPNERTALAWLRTGLSFAAMGALLLHASDGLTRPAQGLLGAVALAVGGAGVLTARQRYRDADAAVLRGGRVAPHAWLLRAMAALTVTLSVILLVAALLEAG